MGYPILAGIFAILFSITLTVVAQTSEPSIVWPPDPSAIFHESVQWSVIEQTTIPVYFVQPHQESRTIRVFNQDENTWAEYPYPADIPSISSGKILPDGRIELLLNFENYRNPRPDDILLLDPATGLYESPPTVCDGQVIQQPPGLGDWSTAYFDEENRREYLCHSESGEQRDILPVGLNGWEVYPSPDKSWLVLIAQNWNEGGDFDAYAYQPTDNQLLFLGRISRVMDDVAYVCDWLTETQGLICRSPRYHSWIDSSYYGFDLTQADSLIAAVGGWSENMFRLDEPARYASVYSEEYYVSITGGRGSEHRPCRLRVFDATGSRDYELGYECVPIVLNNSEIAPYLRHGNIIYYLTYDNHHSTVSTLRSFDIAQETASEPLLSTEIENVLSVSPGDKYIVVIVDDDGELNFPWDSCCFPGRGWQILILEKHTRHIVYYSEPLGVHAANQIVWLDEHTVVISARETLKIFRHTEQGDIWTLLNPPSLRRITFDDEGFDVSMTTRYAPQSHDMRLSPDGHYLIDENKRVFDLYTLEEISILLDTMPEYYNITMGWLEDGDLNISVSVRDIGFENYRVTLSPEH